MVPICTTLFARRMALLVPTILPAAFHSSPAAAAQCSGVVQNAATGVVQDAANFLSSSERARLERIIGKLEADTGFELRVLSRARNGFASDEDEEVPWTRRPPSQILQCGFSKTPGVKTILIVADRGIAGALDAGSSFITFPYIGDAATLALPGVFFGRLQREYGRKAYVSSRGEAASIVATCEVIITVCKGLSCCLPS